MNRESIRALLIEDSNIIRIKEIISSHGGAISAANGAHGARFSMKLPISHSNNTFTPEA